MLLAYLLFIVFLRYGGRLEPPEQLLKIPGLLNNKKSKSAWHGCLMAARTLSPCPPAPTPVEWEPVAVPALGAGSVVDRIMAPQDVLILSPKAWEYVTLRVKRDFANVIMLRILR